MSSNDRTFHVVCRDCQTESIVDTKSAAKELVDDHATDSDHAVDFARIE